MMLPRLPRASVRALVSGLLSLLLGVTQQAMAADSASDQMPVGDDSASYFLVAKVNGGLAAVGDELDLETPHAMLVSFLSACRNGDFSRAAHCLNLNFLGPLEQQAKGPELARKLFFIIEHQLWIDWDDFPDRPDGRKDNGGASEQPADAGKSRSILLGVLNLPGGDVELRTQRLKTRDGPAVWVFSRQTAEAIDELYREYGPNRFERGLPAWLSTRPLGRMPLWMWAGLTIVPVISVLAGWIVQRACVVGLRRCPWGDTEFVSAALRGPVACLVALSLFHRLSYQYLRIAAPIQAILDPTTKALWIASFSWLLMRVAKQFSLISRRRYERLGGQWANSRITQITMLRYLVVFVIFAAGSILALRQFAWFRDLASPLLTSAGVLGVIVGLAAHRSIGNLIAVIQLALTQPVSAGDAVLYGGDFGWIEEIGFTFVVIRTWDQRRVITPIAHLIDNPIINWSKKSEAIISYIFIYVDYRIDVDALRSEYESVLESAPDWDHETPPILQVTNWGQTSLELRGLCSACSPARAWNLQCYVRERLLAYVQRLDGGRYLPRTRILLARGDRCDADDRSSTHDERADQLQYGSQR